MSTLALSLLSRGAILQDAYWYAERAAGGDDMFNGAYSRSKALRLAHRKAREAGMKIGTRSRIEHAHAVRYDIECFAREFGLEARTGQVARCEQCDKPLNKHDHKGCHWTRETERGRLACVAVAAARGLEALASIPSTAPADGGAK